MTSIYRWGFSHKIILWAIIHIKYIVSPNFLFLMEKIVVFVGKIAFFCLFMLFCGGFLRKLDFALLKMCLIIKEFLWVQFDNVIYCRWKVRLKEDQSYLFQTILRIFPHKFLKNFRLFSVKFQLLACLEYAQYITQNTTISAQVPS